MNGMIGNTKKQEADLAARVQQSLLSEQTEEEGEKIDTAIGQEHPIESPQSVASKVPSLDLTKVTEVKPKQVYQKSEAELSIEKAAALSKIEGPSEKQWDNFGVDEADDKEQIIKVDKVLTDKGKQKIKATVDKQMHQMWLQKRGWAYYEKHQPDYTAFQTEIKRMIMTLVGPTVSDNTSNGIKIDQVKRHQDDIERRMNEIEFIYKKVATNATAQQDALSDLETRSKALVITEHRLNVQVHECKLIKEQLEDKFKMLRDDRMQVFYRLDHVDQELDESRAEVRRVHDQISASVFEKVKEAYAKSLSNEVLFEGMQTKLDQAVQNFDNLITQDFRDQAIAVGSLQENFIDSRQMFNKLQDAIVSRIDWNEKNSRYDQEISLLMSKNNQLEVDQYALNKYMQGVHKTEVQSQIDSTMQAVLGDRTKYMKMLKTHQDDFYQKLDQIKQKPGGVGQKQEISRAQVSFPSLKSGQGSDDDSLQRLKKNMTKLTGVDAIMSPVNLASDENTGLESVNAPIAMAVLQAGAGAQVNGTQVMQMLKQHEKAKLVRVRNKYLMNIPLRRMARYRDNIRKEFVQDKNSKLRVLTNKQQEQMTSLNVFRHLAIQNDKRISSSHSNSSLMSRRSGISVNQRIKLIPGQSLDKKTFAQAVAAVPKLGDAEAKKNKTQGKRQDYQELMQNSKEMKNTFEKLKDRLKLQITQEVLAMLQKQNKSDDVKVKLLKVKQRTIQGAIDAFKDDRDYQMKQLEVTSIIQVLSMNEVKDDFGNIVNLKAFDQSRHDIVKRIVDFEYEHQGESSSEHSSKASRRLDIVRPPVIAIEVQNTIRSRRESKTMLKTMVTPALDGDCSLSSNNSASLKSIRIVSQTKAEPQSKQKSQNGNDKGLDSRKSSSESLRVKLVLNGKISSKGLTEISSDSSRSPTPQVKVQGLEEQKKILNIKVVEQARQKPKRRPISAGHARDHGDGTVEAQGAQIGQDESYEFPEDTIDDSGTGKGRYDRIKDEELGYLPDQVDVPAPDRILEAMKDQIDELEQKLKDRTNEIREVQKFVKRLEQGTISELTKKFSDVVNLIQYEKADMKEFTLQRMDIIGNSFVRNNKKLSSAADNTGQDMIAVKKRIKVFGRRVEQRMDAVNADHGQIMGKYDYLLKCNGYVSKLAEQMIKVVELNSCLVRADERDKRSICLMGSKGAQTVQEKSAEVHMMRLQQQVDGLEQSDLDRSAGQQPAQQIQNSSMRPMSGVSRFSQKSGAHQQTILSQPCQYTKSKFGATVGDDQQPVLQMDKRCQTCSDNKGKLLHLFKIACLSYFPGQVDYRGKKYNKQALLQQQDEYINDLKRILASSAPPQAQNEITPALKKRTESQRADEDVETQLNTERRLNLFSSEGGVFSNNIRNVASHSQPSTERKEDSDNQEGSQGGRKQPDTEQVKQLAARVKEIERIQLQQQEEVMKQSRRSVNTGSGQTHAPQNSMKSQKQPVLSLKSKNPMQNEALSGKESTSNRMSSQDAINVAKLSGLSNLQETNEQVSSPKRRRVSFDKIHSPKSPHQRQAQKLDQTQTSYRFNCTHQLLAFNQEQVSQMVPNSIHEQRNKALPLNEKLLQIQKLKEKTMILQMTREVNKPNRYVAAANSNSSPLHMGKGITTPPNEDVFPTREQVKYSRDVVRRKHTKETQLLIETRERFTKRYQFEKLSHQMMDGTPTETQLSGSAHNELARYESKTIFRQAHQQPPTPTQPRIPKTYANLMKNESSTLPMLTRNYSAAYNTGTLAFGAEENMAFTDGVGQHPRTRRNQRPISSMNNQKSFWKTAKRNDGRSILIVNKERVRELDWSKPRESAGTEQINQMLAGTNNMSVDNISRH